MKARKGFTLIEVIVTLAIIGIITVPLLTIFTNSFKNIIHAGRTTINTYEYQDEINEKIIINDGEDITIQVTIPGVISNLPIQGKQIIDNENLIRTFVPND